MWTKQPQQQTAEEHLVSHLIQETHLQELPYPPRDLKDSELDKVGVALTADSCQYLVEIYQIRICHIDLSTLEPTAWLNDEVRCLCMC